MYVAMCIASKVENLRRLSPSKSCSSFLCLQYYCSSILHHFFFASHSCSSVVPMEMHQVDCIRVGAEMDTDTLFQLFKQLEPLEKRRKMIMRADFTSTFARKSLKRKLFHLEQMPLLILLYIQLVHLIHSNSYCRA